ncbi:methyltransferase family protein [Croceimicrobium sp.]|uniref:methyltransferase family protein n=1 Tax=Croceimicrobium sp. TaxID=2828340 RepID=UPI003BAC167F
MPLKALDYFLVSLQGLLFILFFIPVDWLQAVKIPDLMLWPAQLAMIIGILEVIWALKQMGRYLSPFPKPKADAELITWGVFGLVRHPIYSGIILFAAGFGIYFRDPFQILMAGVLALFFYFKSRYEEKNLRAYFPNYASYQKRTGRFIPNLFAAKPK